MIGRNQQMRDWLNVVSSARSYDQMRGATKAAPRSKVLKNRLDDFEQRRQFRDLVGEEPIETVDRRAWFKTARLVISRWPQIEHGDLWHLLTPQQLAIAQRLAIRKQTPLPPASELAVPF